MASGVETSRQSGFGPNHLWSKFVRAASGIFSKGEPPAPQATPDTIVTRHFFIHQPFENAVMVSKLARYLMKPGGLFVADYYEPPKEKLRKIGFRWAKSKFDPSGPSHLYRYSENEKVEVAEKAGLTVEEMDHHLVEEKCFVRMRK